MKYKILGDIWIGGKYLVKGEIVEMKFKDVFSQKGKNEGIAMFYNYAVNTGKSWNDRGELEVLFVGGPIAGKSMRLRTPLESLIQVPYISEESFPTIEEYEEFMVGGAILSNQVWHCATYKLVDCRRVGSVIYEWENTVPMNKLPEKYQRLIVRTS